MIKKFIPLLFVACGIVLLAHNAASADALSDALTDIKYRSRPDSLNFGVEVKYNRNLDNNQEIKDALAKWKQNCQSYPTSTFNSHVITTGMTKTDIVTTTKGLFVIHKCVITECKSGLHPSADGKGCEKDNNTSDGINNTATESDKDNKSGAKKTAKEKMDEHNQEYLAKQNASKLKTQIEQINKSADKLKLGDKLKWNASFNDDAGIDAALKAWVDKCDTLATGNIADTTTLGRESDGEFKCVIKTCKNGFNKNKSGTVCTNDPAAAEFADKFQEINDKFKSDVAAAWRAHNAAQAKSTK